MYGLLFWLAAFFVVDVDNDVSFFDRSNVEARVAVITILIVAGLIAFYIEARYDNNDG